MSLSYIGDGPTGAIFDETTEFRYSLWRRWQADAPDSNLCAFIGLNPSTADETENDPTVRRCIGFARDWGFGGMVMLNLFGFRATDPDVMKRHGHVVGRDNDLAIKQVVGRVAQTICCWGNEGVHVNRCTCVRFILRDCHLYHLGLTKLGHPKHPLYLPANSERVLWKASK